MEFEKPVRDGLAVPPHRQVLWIIFDLIILVIAVLSRHLVGKQLFRIHGVFLCLYLAVATRLFLAHLVLSLFKDFSHDSPQPQDPGLTTGYAPQS